MKNKLSLSLQRQFSKSTFFYRLRSKELKDQFVKSHYR